MPSPKATRVSDSTLMLRTSRVRSPSVRVVPLAGDGHASRTNQLSLGSAGSGRRNCLAGSECPLALAQCSGQRLREASMKVVDQAMHFIEVPT